MDGMILNYYEDSFLHKNLQKQFFLDMYVCMNYT